jgi:methionine--tRNA ligase beta chain
MSNISLSDFQKLDIRIGTVIKAEVPDWSHWVMKLTVDLGPEIGERTIFAGLINDYKVEDIEGKQFPFLTNIEPKKVGPEGDFSEGMMLAAGDDKPYIFHLEESVPNGTEVR